MAASRAGRRDCAISVSSAREVRLTLVALPCCTTGRRPSASMRVLRRFARPPQIPQGRYPMRLTTLISCAATLLALGCGSAHAQATAYDNLDHFVRPSPATPADEIRVAYSDQCGRAHPD